MYIKCHEHIEKNQRKIPIGKFRMHQLSMKLYGVKINLSKKFWMDLAEGKKMIAIYKNGTHKYINLPKPTTQKYTNMITELDDDDEVVSILSSGLSSDWYELYLYPKAKDKSVEYVIKNYKKYFRHMLNDDNKSIMKKIRVF